MNKEELVKEVSARSGVKKKDTNAVINSFIDTVFKAMEQDESITIVGFGKFETRTRKERNARNPQTGETMLIPATKVPYFKAGKNLREVTTI